MKISGCDTLTGYFDVAHALSLIDTFWVKRVDSALSWNQVSLFTHPFNEVIAKTAFEGGLHVGNLATTSPEYGTDGSFAKCWIREGDKIRMLKRGSSAVRNVGLEPYSEYYASQIADALNLSHVEYELRTHDGRVCSVCDCFTTEDMGFIPYSAFVSDNRYSYFQIIDKLDESGFKEYFREMFIFDAVIFNEDRHLGNFGFIVDNNTWGIIEPAPLFDHNVSLLCYAEEDQFQDVDNYLSEKGPRLGEDFIGIAKYLMTPKMRKKLIGLRGFKFDRSGKINLPDWRLDRLEKLIQDQLNKILS